MSRRLLSSYAEAASRAAVAAGSFVVQYAGRPKTVQTKRSAIDLVTEIDRAAEQMIRRRLVRAYPEIGFLGEEHGERAGTTAGRWIVDPIDGTNNFVHGFPFFGVSIGLELRGRMAVGVIYDPTRRELFVGINGRGAFLNGRRIRVSARRAMTRSLLATGFSTRFLTHTQPYLRWFQAFQRNSHGVRRLGSTVLSLAAIAAGRLEGFYERDLWPWDIAAGLVLIEEAGGRVSNLQGGPVVLDQGHLLASNGHIHHQLLQILHDTTARSLVKRVRHKT